MDILNFIAQVVNAQQVFALAILLVVNFCTGLLAGIMTKTLDWGQLKDIWKRAGILFGAYLIMSVPAYYLSNAYSTDWVAIRTFASVALSAFLIDKILVNLKEMGIPLPAVTSDGGIISGRQKANGVKVTSVLRALPLLKFLSVRS